MDATHFERNKTRVPAHPGERESSEVEKDLDSGPSEVRRVYTKDTFLWGSTVSTRSQEPKPK